MANPTPRADALRAMREAKYEAQQRLMKQEAVKPAAEAALAPVKKAAAKKQAEAATADIEAVAAEATKTIDVGPTDAEVEASTPEKSKTKATKAKPPTAPAKKKAIKKG